ncbi:hypothetical protein BJY52DRAFT_1256249 [Lactarius psammicola]|nr:hypothetical protein BJY52DRAFT_1256249 [Lactarius psammicola]
MQFGVPRQPSPPPSQPIPSVPMPDTTAISSADGSSFMDDDPPMSPAGMIQNFARPAASPRLATFSQAQVRHTSPAVAPIPSTNGTRSPPRQRPLSPPVQHQEIVPDRLLISSRDSQQSSERSRPSSRRALTKALELAREAVKLDSTNDDPYGAVVAYGKSVALLSKVMERVMSGEDSTESIRRRGGRRRSVVAQEEEVRRLKAIHDTYADRMNILSLIYSITPPPHSPSTLYPTSISTSTDSTQPPSPVSASPSSDSSDHHLLREPSAAQFDGADIRRLSQETAKYELFEGGDPSELETSGYNHPYSAASVSQPFDNDPETPIARETVVVPNGKRSTAPPPARHQPPSPPPAGPSSGLRPRATSDLPPPAPPPHSALPPAPHQPISGRHLNATRPRGQSTSHSRTGSNSRLEPLQEERDKQPEQQTSQGQQRVNPGVDDDLRHQPRSTQMDAARTQPLPPLPSADSLAVSRDTEPVQDRSPTSVKFGSRPRGGSTFSTRSEIISPATLISNSTTMGTISQRRSKTSAPPATSTTSSIQSADAVPPPTLKPKMLSLTTSVPPPSYARSRASSQPGQRPSITGLPSLSYDASVRPPSAVAMLPRKTSVSSKSNSSLPQITVVTGYLSPPLDTPANQLVPPPPIPHSNLPTTPTSPLPPTAPSDPLRKPYHMMSLLRHTMISKTGGYITQRLHGGARLLNLPEKVRVVEVLCSSLEEVQHTSGGVFGAGNVSASLAPGIGKKEGELWSLKLEEFSNVCDGVVANFGKKLGVGEGFMIKKNSGVTSWGGKLTRQLDKLTNQKNLDSPASYVQGLSRLFAQVQLLDEHSRAVSMQPIAPAYASLTPELRSAIESKLRRSSEFFATVVLTFVVRDMAQLLDKYVKKCEKWLAE